MASIIRSSILSEQTRKLAARRSLAKEPRFSASPAVAAVSDAAVESVPLPKAAQPEPSGPGVEELVEQARLAVLAQVKEEAEAARELARQRGLQEGRAAGMDEVKQAAGAELERIRSVADKLQQSLEGGLRGLEDMATAIAFEAICKVLGQTATTVEGVQALVREATTHVVNAERLVVRLHPEDLSNLRSAGALDAQPLSGAAVSWAADEKVALGGCVVETDGGELDARLETQVERLRTALSAARGRGTAPASRDGQISAMTPERRKTDRRKVNRAGVFPDRRKKSRRANDTQ